MSLALLLLVLTTMTAWAENVNLSEDPDITVGTAGHYYVNMPKTGTNTLTITAQDIADGKGTFKVYDDGGKSGYYSNDCNGYLTLTAPEGYVLYLSGSVTTDGGYDKLTIYDGSTTSSTKLLDGVTSSPANSKKDIKAVTSTSNVTMLYFTTGASIVYGGLDLTVTLISTSQYFNINVNTATGGSVTANPTSAKVFDNVVLTAEPDNGYVLSDISATDANSNAVALDWNVWTNTASFAMHSSDVTVTPTFTNDLTNLSVKMPVTGTKNATIPSGVVSFKVYDDGGSNGKYSNNCDGLLVLTAPEGYVLQLSGNITSESNHDKLTVYNGGKTSSSKLINEVCNSSGTAINTVSTGNVMTLKFVSDSGLNYDGFDLTVTLVDPNADFNINVDNSSATGGSVESDKAKAKVTNLITLTATPDNNYLLSGISVTDANSNPVAVTWDGSFSNTATFNMPISDVTVTPTFTNTLTAAGGLFINVSATGSNNVREIQIPNGVQSFKVYDDGGVNGIYSNSFEGTLMLTAPTGYVLQLSGGITTEAKYDKLTVYDGSKASGNVLLNAVSGTLNDIDETSTGNVMTIHFKSDGSGNNFAGLDLTVTLFKDIATFPEADITVPNQTLGTYTAINYKFEAANSGYTSTGTIVKDGDTPLELGTDYVFGSVTRKDNGEITDAGIGDECLVEIVGKGNYTGKVTREFKIVAPDANGTWDNLTWAFHDGTLTISPAENVQTLVAMKETNAGDYPWFSSANYIETITIGEGVSTVAANAFNRATEMNVYGNVKTVSLPSTLTTIGDNAFAFCTGATITIPESVTTLGANPFNQVRSLEISKPLEDGNDNSDIISKMSSAQNATFTYKRSFTVNVASTVCLPFAHTPGTGEGTYYTFTTINKETSPWTVTMTATAASLKANTPYMFMPAVDAVSFNGTASKFTYDLTGADVNDPKVDGGKWNLIGTYESRQWDDTHNNEEIGKVYGFAAQNYDGVGYTVNPGDFVKAAAGASIAPFRAYLKYTAPVNSAPNRRAATDEVLPSRMSVRLVNAEGIVTAIGTIDTNTGEVRFDSDAWYSIDGSRLNGKPAQKGVYINNGKKIVIK